MKKYDAIVIGAGHNGITNAPFLRKAGLDVLLAEKNEYVGGEQAVLAAAAAQIGLHYGLPTWVAAGMSDA